MEAINAILSDFMYLVKSSEKPKYKLAPEKPKDKRKIRREGLSRAIVVSSRCDFDVNFQDFKDVYNTKVFMDNFQRPALTDTKLNTYVTLEDVKDIVLYTAVYDIPKDFIRLFLSDQVDRILRSLVLYMQYFLEIFRVVVKRREAVNTKKLRHPISACMETLWKESLSNLRFILARDYCFMLMGMNGTERFHHYDCSKKLSRQSRDLMFYQLFFIFARRLVEVVLMEKNNPLVEEEMERLFNVGGPKVDRRKKYGLTQLDLDILEHNFTVPTLRSRSVLSKEFSRPNRNILLKTIGQQPWLPRDAPSYFQAIEMVLAGGESRFVDANIRVGILGYERHDFDCMLNLESTSVQDNKSYTVSDSDSTQDGTIVTINRLIDKSVNISGPSGLLPKRDENAKYVFEEKYLGRCENHNEYHMKIRKPRWIAFRKANSRVNYEPDDAVTAEHKEMVQDMYPSPYPKLKGNIVTSGDPKKKSGLPSFFFSCTAKSDSEDDIYALYHEGFYNEQVKKMARLNKKIKEP